MLNLFGILKDMPLRQKVRLALCTYLGSSYRITPKVRNESFKIKLNFMTDILLKD